MIRTLLGRWRGAHGNHRRIAAGAFWIGLFALAAKLCVAAREMAIAWRYGISAEVDAYQIALTVTTWLPMMLFGLAGIVLVPRLVGLRRTGGDVGFVEELNGAVLIVGGVMALLTWIAAPFATDLLTGTLSPATRRLAESLSRNLAPIAFLIVVGGYFSARLQARERYVYSVADAAPALAIALFVIAGSGGGQTAPLLYGTLLGYGLYALWLARMTATSDPPLGRIRIRHRSEQWTLVYGSFLTMGLGQLFITAAIPIDQAFAATQGEGAVATLGYVNRIVTLITGFGSVVFARALLPVLSGVVAEGDDALARRQALHWAGLMALLAAVGGAVAWLLAPIGVRILFQRGAFHAQQTELVSEVLRYGQLQLAPFFSGIVLVQYYAAANRFRAILAITVAALIVKVAANFLLVPALGVSGIMVSTAAMYATTALLMALGFRWRAGPSGKGSF